MTVDHRRVLVVEDEPLMAGLIAEVLIGHGFEVRIAGNVSEARRTIDRFDPDMLLLDVSLGDGPTGVHLANAMHLSRPEIAILVFTRHDDIASATGEGFELPPGVGLLRKHRVSDEKYLLDAIEKVFEEQSDKIVEIPQPEEVFSSLGGNGLRVLRLIAEGNSNIEIALRCGVSVKTAERWIEQIYKDLAIDTKGSLNPRVEAARRFYLAVGIPTTST